MSRKVSDYGDNVHSLKEIVGGLVKGRSRPVGK